MDDKVIPINFKGNFSRRFIRSDRTVVYNVNCPMVALLVVTEKLQWDDVLKKNVWAHPMFVCTLVEALKRIEQETGK